MLPTRTYLCVLPFVALVPVIADAIGGPALEVADSPAKRDHSTDTITRTSFVTITLGHQQQAPATMASDDSPGVAIPPTMTAAPDVDVSEAEKELKERFLQTTYYTCITKGTYSHCGWHKPIIDATLNHGSARRPSALLGWTVAAAAGLLAAIAL